MSLLRISTVQKILLELPNSKELPDFSDEEDTVFIIGNIVVVIPTKGITVDHLSDILENQLEMSWWMIDYVYGQNGIK